MEAASRLGKRYMLSYLRQHPENTDAHEALFSRAFYPQGIAALENRLRRLGIAIVEGPNPMIRESSLRAQERWANLLKVAIRASIARLDEAQKSKEGGGT